MGLLYNAPLMHPFLSPRPDSNVPDENVLHADPIRNMDQPAGGVSITKVPTPNVPTVAPACALTNIRWTSHMNV